MTFLDSILGRDCFGHGLRKRCSPEACADYFDCVVASRIMKQEGVVECPA